MGPNKFWRNRKKGKYEETPLTEKEMSQFKMRLYRTLATTSKQLIWFYAINGVAWIWCSYILAFLGKEQIAEALSSTVCEVIVGTSITYLVTSTVESVFKYNDFNGRLKSKPYDPDLNDLAQAAPDEEVPEPE